MKIILITPQIQKLANSLSNKIKSDPNNKPIEKLTLLESKIRAKGIPWNDYADYVKLIIDSHSDLIVATPSQMEKFINDFNRLNVDLSICFFGNKKFSAEIIDAMGYTILRSDYCVPFLLISGIKTCVYCNAQLTITVDKYVYKEGVKVKKKWARLQLDHFYPKSKYPYFSTSFFNLYPTCSNCNQIKSNNTNVLDFELYTENPSVDTNPFKFSLEPQSIVKYKTTYNPKSIQIEFMGTDPIRATHFDETFCIKAIYETQKDVAEELIVKTGIYTSAYKQSLLNTFPKAIQQQNFVDRVLLGNYCTEDDIHKRPMAKFMQDIAKQLHLI